MLFRSSLAAFALLLAGTSVLAQGNATRVGGPAAGISFSGPWRPNGPTSGLTRVVGTVIDIRQVPVTKAKVRLRNLDDSTVLAETETDDSGAYLFDVDVPSTYVVEMVMTDGYVVAVSNAGSLARFDTLNTVIQLPGRWDARTQVVIADTSLLDVMRSQNITTAATLAMSSNIAIANAGEPVSP